MPVLRFIFLIIITTVINVFITAFLIARSQYSQKVLRRLRNEAHAIIKAVNKATEEHITIAEGTIGNLKKLLSEHKNSLRTKMAQTLKIQKSQRARMDDALELSKKRAKESCATSAKKTISQSPESIQNAIVTMLKNGKSEAYIREHLTVSKAELTLAKFIHKNKR